MSTPEKDEATGTDTTGHTWDGIKELNTPLPRWWLWTFYFTIIWGIAYTIAYPAWPLVNKATQGFLGFNQRTEVASEIERFNTMNADLRTALAEADLTTVKDNPDLHNFAVQGGASVFRAQCSQCHGSGAQGATGYPNLLDNDWLWGGEIEEIAYTINNGIRNETDDAHYSEMPAFGELLETEEIDQVLAYVQKISGQEHDAGLAEAGMSVFADQCSSCHAEDGTGDKYQGAPNLTDAIWLYGGDADALRYTIENARFGVMPAWGKRLSASDVNAVAVYVHGLGGGE
ncbi:MAG: cytochrome-c oxidase, cbb3-type subunit III [Silicimonas sp.]|nr:cytochrome-c oxidase, cbb3-type subunit III [Silicimonas sp.]